MKETNKENVQIKKNVDKINKTLDSDEFVDKITNNCVKKTEIKDVYEKIDAISKFLDVINDIEKKMKHNSELVETSLIEYNQRITLNSDDIKMLENKVNNCFKIKLDITDFNIKIDKLKNDLSDDYNSKFADLNSNYNEFKADTTSQIKLNKEQIDNLIKSTECIPSIQSDLDTTIKNLKHLEEQYKSYTNINDTNILKLTNEKADKLLFDKLFNEFKNHKSSYDD